MTAIVTWNIQAGKGCDGVTDLARIAAVVKSMGEADVICLQEVARHEPTIAGGADQAAELQALFPGYEAVFGAALVRGQRQFG
ncbi:MAG TPA: endonuclease, partial [Thermodesulfobacteriota bacterium]